MISIEIDNIKSFMSHLLIKDNLDYFLCKEISIQTFSTFNVDGSIVSDFLTEEEKENLKDKKYIPWGMLKPYCFNIIKGTRTPLSMKAVFVLAAEDLKKLIAKSGLNIDASPIEGLYLNIRFEGNKLNLISGSSLNYFTLDKTVDRMWDEEVKESLSFLFE